eukprot:scaffold103100_cov57-Phaeocystis_antarctica.AAC.5
MSDRLRSVHFTRRSCYYATATKPDLTCSSERAFKRDDAARKRNRLWFEPGRHNDSVDSWMHGFMDAMLPRGTLSIPRPATGPPDSPLTTVSPQLLVLTTHYYHGRRVPTSCMPRVTTKCILLTTHYYH